MLRLVAGVLLIYDGVAGLRGGLSGESATPHVVAAVAAIFLVAGLWTPIFAAVVALVELWIAFSGTGHLRSTILLVAISVAIAVLGPGARSIDALLFGRRRLNI